MTRWYRAYEGTVTDPKLGEVALVAGCSRSVVIASWHCLLESAAATNDGGRFETTARRIAVTLGEPVLCIEKIMQEMAELCMIEDGALCAWKARQFESDSSTERSRKHRATKRNGDATLQERSATAPDTETEPEKISEAKASSPRVARSTDPFPCPDGVDPVDWSSLLALRKSNHKAINAGAYQQILKKLARWSDAGWPPGPIVANAVERGWLTVFETDEMKNGQLGRNNGQRPAERSGGLEAVGRDVLETLRAREGNIGPARQTGTPNLGAGDGRVVALPAPGRDSGDERHGPPRMALGGL